MHPNAKVLFKKRFTSGVPVMTDSTREKLEDFGCLEPVKVAKFFSMALTCCSDDPRSSQMSSQSLLKDFGKVAFIYWVNCGPLKASCLSNVNSSNRVYNTRTDNGDASFLLENLISKESKGNFKEDHTQTLPSFVRRIRPREIDFNVVRIKRCRRH
ncbi:hypothetical protein HOLleu_07714 [Holothuria leucospilota]|uniref:Uncharacterized protein n=1 Tax=Holothuria leucospilota TaxID=206669 RepID=A0A9Q1CHI0_HOLLE|nr:hypothetical protein HOLleu_07714 [Holothuria leucospilota]